MLHLAEKRDTAKELLRTKCLFSKYFVFYVCRYKNFAFSTSNMPKKFFDYSYLVQTE